jgi:putative protease
MIHATALSEDGRSVSETFEAGDQTANNFDRMMEMVKGQIGKTSGGYQFLIGDISTKEGLPFMTASFINGIRRRLAEILDSRPCGQKGILLRKPGKVTKPLPQEDTTYKNNISNHLAKQVYLEAGAASIAQAYELEHTPEAELMRTRYCIRFELGMCPKHQGAKQSKPLFLLNNGQRFALHFDCRNCEMTVTEA